MSEVNDNPGMKHSFRWRLFHFLGSMELAITLLLTLAVASVIGTVLQQNQPYNDYLIKFGPFWFQIFKSLGLYDVYSAIWFLVILALLVASTSVCIIRHAPSMLKDMFNMRTHVQEKSLEAMHHNQHWSEQGTVDSTAEDLSQSLNKLGFKTRITGYGDKMLVSAMRGGLNRLGYILTHAAIIIICVGGMMDSKLPFKVAEWQGKLKIETKNLPLAKVPKISQLPVGPQAFRGSVSIPEGKSTQVAYVAMRDGYLVQRLPFTLDVKQFRIEHYPTGQPKSFETDLVLHDKDLAKPKKVTISVNHPLIYKGYAIYQSSFGDGGSHLSINAWPLDPKAGTQPVPLKINVFDSRKMRWSNKSLELEMDSFRRYNINPDPTKDDPEHVVDNGPSIGFKLRDKTGQAREYVNFMYPVQHDGRQFFLSGVRNSPAENFAYLYIPADQDNSLKGFFNYYWALNNKQNVDKIAQGMVVQTLQTLNSKDEKLRESLQSTLVTLVNMFMHGGYAEVRHFIQTSLPQKERDKLGPAYLSMLREILGKVYFQETGIGDPGKATQQQLKFLQDAVDAIGVMPSYGSPVFLHLTNFKQIQASGLQIAHSPGKPVVYLGCAFLIAGVFLLFYLPQRRFWAWIKPEQNAQVNIRFAGMSNRNPREFDRFFAMMLERIKRRREL